MRKKVEFEKVTEARGRNNYMKQTGINFSFMDYADGPEIKITPINTTGRSEAAVMHIPLEEVQKTVVAIIETAGIDIVEFAKETLVANGYVRHFWSKVDIQDWATGRYRPLTEEELEKVAYSLSKTDCEYGISWQVIDDTITSTINWDWEASDMEAEEDESDEFRHIINQYTPDEQ